MVLFNMCPMWSTPVTFGGGITIVYGSRASGRDLNRPLSVQYEYHFPSISEGLYLLASSIYILIVYYFSFAYASAKVRLLMIFLEYHVIIIDCQRNQLQYL